MCDNICPLIAIAVGPRGGSVLCVGECCAWWDPLECGCCLCAIASAIQYLGDKIPSSSAKPHPFQKPHGEPPAV